MKKRKKKEVKLDKLYLDNKSIFRIIIASVIFLIMGIWIYFPNLFSADKYEDMEGQTFGVVHSIKPIELMEQTFEGNRMRTVFYEIVYSFAVNKKSFENKMTLANIAGNSKFIWFVRENLGKKAFIIRYDFQEPGINALDTRMNQYD